MKKRSQGILIIAIALAALIVSLFIFGLDTSLILIFLFLAIMGIGVSMIVDGNKSVETGSSRAEDEVVDSKTLHSEMNRDLKRDGKSPLEAINTMGGVSTNNLARKDKSWNSVPDFFIKTFKKK